MSGAPTWRRIADDLRTRIDSGEFAASGPRDLDRPTPARRPKLPSELELQTYYGVSRNTVRDALRSLVDQHLVEPYPGKGYFVLDRGRPYHVTLSGPPGRVEDARVQSRVPVDGEPVVQMVRADAKFARELRVEEGSKLVLRRQHRYIDDRPWALRTTYYPWRLVEQGADLLLDAADIEVGALRYLEDALGLRQTGYHDAISARVADADEARFLHVTDAAGYTVFEHFRTAFHQDGNVARLTVTVWPIDRNRLHYNVGEVPPETVASPSRRFDT